LPSGFTRTFTQIAIITGLLEIDSPDVLHSRANEVKVEIRAAFAPTRTPP
jgi:hypothetical protein